MRPVVFVVRPVMVVRCTVLSCRPSRRPLSVLPVVSRRRRRRRRRPPSVRPFRRRFSRIRLSSVRPSRRPSRLGARGSQGLRMTILFRSYIWKRTIPEKHV